MFRALLVLASVIGASAFAPSKMTSKAAALKMSFENALGAQPPLGFFDPLGLLKNADQERFDRLRTVEVKHGRISMLAILGHLYTTAGNRLPGEIAYGVPFTSVKAGLAAFDNIPAAGLLQLFLFIGLLENGFSLIKENLESDCKAYMTANGWSEAKQQSKAAIELNNGRAAQMGIFGLVVHEKIDNNPYILNSLLGFPVAFNQ